jgi:ribosome-associated translation inhibitor RaiA
MYAAIDIAEEKLKHSLRKYKEKHNTTRLHRKIMARFKRQYRSELNSEPL